LKFKDFSEIVKPFESSQNKVLVDYSKFRKWLFQALREYTVLQDKIKLKKAREQIRLKS